MTCPRCAGLTSYECDRHNPGNWVYCVNCGWRGDDPARIAVLPVCRPDVIDPLYAIKMQGIRNSALVRTGRPLSEEHRAKLRAYHARRRAMKENPCNPSMDLSA
jgi:hypothetical protein